MQHSRERVPKRSNEKKYNNKILKRKRGGLIWKLDQVDEEILACYYVVFNLLFL